MRFLAAILIAACTFAAGCTSLTGRSRDRDRDRDRPAVDRRDRDRDWWNDGSDSVGRGKQRQVPGDLARTDRDSIIAGSVVDARDGKPIKGITYIRVRPAEEVAPASGRGIGFETDADGYFLCAMLTPGKTYLLTVVREIDGRKIAGEMQVKPPSGNLRFELGEDKVSSVTPPLPPPPGLGPFESSAGDRVPLPAPPPSIDKENIAGTPTLPPTAAIRPPPTAAPALPPRLPETEPPMSRAPAPAQRIPNFVVSDITGQDWEYRAATGRLVLVEFWSSTCIPCARAVPSIKKLQNDYGQSGLEIVALACEPDAPFNARAETIHEVARRKELNYRVYLEPDGKIGEVQRLFNIQWVPTLVLLDRQGAVLWRGGATEAELARLEDIAKTYLSRR
ncbi:MAG TPA: thioredoxin-like domain-containing protein [Gemmataceae bacterium]|jgi:thiol-disulfide isomerase/thioredoxin|nr:thioredoxin-like domain-containing protein [Gemmataceae bacterium]